MTKPYIAINASAGSGKTYTLVQRILMICLSKPHQPDAIRHILALTFTNKAANEMKERILSWLGKFVSENYASCSELLDIQKKFRQQGQHIPIEELHRRAQLVLDYILHHYSTINIATIDKFNTRLVRSFSYELGLAQNFNLEIQPEPFLMEAVDQMLDKIGKDTEISETFMDFVNYNLDNHERVNLNKVLYNSAQEFVKDIHYHQLQQNKKFDWSAYEKSKKSLRAELTELKNNSLEIAQHALSTIKEKDLEIEDFAGGKSNSIAKFFGEILRFYQGDRADFPFPTDEAKALENFVKGASSKGKNKESSVLEILDFLMENRRSIIQNYILAEKKEKILRALLPLRVNKEIQDELAKIEEENDLVLLSKFNILINENLKNEPSAFIYEKVGTQYSHYFFDEFQDTSALQWQNFLPLRDHNISSENTSFTLVGDPKQSIYRFRGGDSQLMLDIITHKEETPTPAEIILLKDNYRSGKNIVAFNNEFYRYLSELTHEEHRKIFGEHAQQFPKADFEGRVRVNFMENDKKEIFYEDSSLQMQKDIQECLNHGFQFSDITILCRGNFDIFNYAQFLGKLRVNYRGKETYIKTISERGLTLDLSATLNALIQFLRWENAPKNRQFLVIMMYHLNQLGRISMQDFSSEILEILEIKDRKQIFDFIKTKYGVSLQQNELLHLNLYNFIEYFVHEFAVEHKETDFLLNFLELLYNFTQNTGATLKDFLNFWDEEGHKMSIQASDNVDAIHIMTIHKAKGLEFPIVLLPMENTNKDSKFQEWYSLDDSTELHSVNISNFSDKLGKYDSEIEKFNQENTYKNFIDRLCLQYVATTRPVEQLFLYIQKPNKTANHIEIYNFLMQNNPKGLDSFDFFEIQEHQLRKQVVTKKEIPQTQGISSIHQKRENQSAIKIATPSKNYQNRNPKVRTGILTHEILAKIIYKKDIEKTLESYVLNGTITQEERAEIFQKITQIVQDERYALYFSENLEEILNERELLISNNGISQLYRPDRVIKTQEGFVIIDFKTGEPQKNHQQQVENYKTVMESLGKKVVKTEIIYI